MRPFVRHAGRVAARYSMMAVASNTVSSASSSRGNFPAGVRVCTSAWFSGCSGSSIWNSNGTS